MLYIDYVLKCRQQECINTIVLRYIVHSQEALLAYSTKIKQNTMESHHIDLN